MVSGAFQQARSSRNCLRHCLRKALPWMQLEAAMQLSSWRLARRVGPHTAMPLTNTNQKENATRSLDVHVQIRTSTSNDLYI